MTSGSFLLPDGWSEPEVVSDVIVADGVTIHRAGAASIGPDGEELCGSAADTHGPALDRAWFELAERVSTMEALRRQRPSYDVVGADATLIERWFAREVFPEGDAPQRWMYARSNGIAIHTSWVEACRRALWELAERDRVLRAWHGELKPRRLDIDVEATPLAPARSYQWCFYTFPENQPASFSVGIAIVGVFGFPLRQDIPFVLGLAGRPERAAALDAASAEALQLLGFLWGEPIPNQVEDKPSAMQHLDAYQIGGRHTYVRRWLEGEHTSYWKGDSAGSDTLDSTVGFIDLTPSWLQPNFRVAKAVCKRAVPLVFGDSPLARHLPEEMRRHPIP